jgi:hypothetical protein
MIPVVKRHGARRGDLFDRHILRPASLFELDREVVTRDPVSENDILG